MAGLVDTTLREGAQAPVRYLSAAQRAAVLERVLAVGVEEVELGCVVARPGYPAEPLAPLVALAARRAPTVRRSLWCRARVDDAEAAAALGPDAVAFAVPVSDGHLTRRLGRDRGWAREVVGLVTARARACGVGYVSVGLEDASRADPAFVCEVAARAGEAGVDRVRVADTVGVAEPGELVRLVERVRAVFAGEVGVHVHNDLGMATAGAVAALAAGAHWADVSLLGLGERAGIARTEEVAAWLVARRGAAYDLVAARAAARELACWVGRDVAPDAPVVGDDVFACESGLHLAGLAVDPRLYEPFPPELVGAQRRWRLGAGSGSAAVAALVGDGGPPAAARLRAAARARRRALTLPECARLLAGASGAGEVVPGV